jgi:transposase-like protein
MTVRIVQEPEAGDVAAQLRLPEQVQLSLLDLQGAVREGLMAMSVGVGLAVLDAMLAEQVTELCGPKGRHDPARAAKRHSTERSSVQLGGQRVTVGKPRVRSADGRREVALPVWEHFSGSDQMGDVVLERLLAGVSTRRYARCTEPVGTGVETSSTSKSSVSRSFVKRTERAYGELMGRSLADERYLVLMIDGIELAGETCVAALGITEGGVKRPLGLWHGSTENHSVAGGLITDLDRRGFDASGGLLVVIDGGKGIAKAVRDHYGPDALIQRCQQHKERNVLNHVPDADRPWLRTRLRDAWATQDAAKAVDKLQRLATELDRTHPDAAKSLREGLEHTVTINRLGLAGTLLAKTLRSTNPIESMISTCRVSTRNVKRWRHQNKMRLRWTAAGMLEAEQGWKRVRGHKQLPQLAAALQRELGKTANLPTQAAQAA